MSEKITKEQEKILEQEKWDRLYQYVRKEIMEYDEMQPLSKHFVLRLKGLRKGQFKANNKIKSLGEYDYETILLTFKINKYTIKISLSNKSFKDEMQKVNYIMAIVENKINDIVNMQREKEKSRVKTEKVDVPKQDSQYVYKKKTKRPNKRLEDLW